MVLVAAVGHCAVPVFWMKLEPVSIRMAKEQDLPLNPMKISGICGRLMCCLGYEFGLYHALRDRLPKRGQPVTTSHGPATVASVNPLKETVVVELESGASVELPLSEVAMEAEQSKRQPPN